MQTYRAGSRGGRRMSRAQVAVRVVARAIEIGDSHPPTQPSERLSNFAKRDRTPGAKAASSYAVPKATRSIGWQGETLILKTREGLEVEVKESNQVWQCDHTRVDLLVVDQVGEVLGRPWLTTIVDTYSRCIIGIHLEMEAPSAVVVCLALRHAILPKQYSSAYELMQLWVCLP